MSDKFKFTLCVWGFFICMIVGIISCVIALVALVYEWNIFYYVGPIAVFGLPFAIIFLMIGGQYDEQH